MDTYIDTVNRLVSDDEVRGGRMTRSRLKMNEENCKEEIFDMNEFFCRPIIKNANERTIIGDISCATNTMGIVDNSVLEKIAQVSR